MKVCCKQKQCSDLYIRAVRNILPSQKHDMNAWTQFRCELIFTLRPAAAGHSLRSRSAPCKLHSHTSIMSKMQIDGYCKALIELRAHHPVALHLQGYTHPCYIGRWLDSVPIRSVTLCSPNTLFDLGLIEISTVERGVISLFGVKSEMFVAMNSRGRLYGTVRVCATPQPHTHTHARMHAHKSW